MPQDFCSKIGAIASTVVNTLVQFGQMIYKGLVALGTFVLHSTLRRPRRTFNYDGTEISLGSDVYEAGCLVLGST